jgi:hypothetical protein
VLEQCATQEVAAAAGVPETGGVPFGHGGRVRLIRWMGERCCEWRLAIEIPLSQGAK